MSEWKEYKLGDLVEVKGGKRLPKGELLVDYDTDHPYIRVTDLGQKWVKKDGLQFVTPEIQKRISRYTVNGGDVILSIVGSIGFTGRISDELTSANLTENCVKFIAITKTIDVDYLYYFLSSKTGQEEIKKRIVGSTQPKLPLYNIKDIEILLPPFPEQKSIAFILSSLDDKIDLLHRQNKTLEALAETLFRQWFVEEAEEGWKTGKLGDYASVSTGKGLKMNEFIEDGIYPVLGANGEIGRTNNYLTNERLILTGRVGTLGKVYITQDKVWISDNVLIVKPIESIYFYTIYFILKRTEFENLNVGSTQPLVTQTDLKNIECKLPGNEKLKSFERQSFAYYEKISSNKTQIRTLTRLRDTLLPKLMSGEVKVVF